MATEDLDYAHEQYGAATDLLHDVVERLQVALINGYRDHLLRLANHDGPRAGGGVVPIELRERMTEVDARFTGEPGPAGETANAVYGMRAPELFRTAALLAELAEDLDAEYQRQGLP